MKKRLHFLIAPMLLLASALHAQQVIDFGGYQLPAPYTNVFTTDTALQQALFGTPTVVDANVTKTYPPTPYVIPGAPYNLTVAGSSATDTRLYKSNPNLSGYITQLEVQNPTLTDYDATGTALNARNGRFQFNGTGSASRTWSVTIPAGQTVTFIIMNDAAAPNVNLSVDGGAYTASTYVGYRTLVPYAYKITNSTGASHVYKFWGNGKLSVFRVYYGDVSNVVSPLWYNGVWENGAPSSTSEAFIGAGSATPVNPTPNYSTTTNGTFTAKKLRVNAGNTLTINSGTSITIQDAVVNSAGATGVIVENNANLIQVNNVANTGAITVKRNSSALSRLDYTLWSSPVASQKLALFSPLTSQSPNRFYTYDTANNVYAGTADPTVTNFTAGAGCLIRMPNTAVASPATETFAGVFTGVPNNGDIPFTLVDGGSGLRYNLVGNPYPSPITISTFVTDNANITGTLYFWRKTNGAGTAYCTVAGGVFTSNGNAQSFDPAGVIQTGQGFIVEANGLGTALTFKNTQRVANTAGQFFKTKQAAVADRVWLNATNVAGDFSQTAVNYTTDATSGVDAFDGKYINDSSFALTSNINNEEYVIQGRPAFDASDVVSLNFKAAAAGDYTIAIDHAEGVFAAGQDVYLVDSTTGTETNLKSGSYTFTAPVGVSNARFSLKYQKTLGLNDVAFNENSVSVYANKGVVYVNSGTATIASVKVYDVQGKLLVDLKDVKSTLATINVKGTKQVLVVKVTAEDGVVVTKKVVN